MCSVYHSLGSRELQGKGTGTLRCQVLWFASGTSVKAKKHALTPSACPPCHRQPPLGEAITQGLVQPGIAGEQVGGCSTGAPNP